MHCVTYFTKAHRVMCDVIVFQSDLMDVVFSFSHTFSQFLLNDTEIGLFTAIVLVTAGTT